MVSSVRWCLIVSISHVCVFLTFETNCLQAMPYHKSLKKDVKSTCPDSLVVKASASGAEG